MVAYTTCCEMPHVSSTQTHKSMRQLTFLFLLAAGYANAQLNDGLVGFWPMNSNFTDASGNGLNGIANVADAQPTDNRSGNEGCAYRMIEGGFNTTTSPLLEVLPTGGLTISYWTRQSQANSFGRVLLQPTGPSLSIMLETWDGGRPSFGQLGAQITADSSQIAFDGQWHLITGVYDAGNWYLYFDANLLQSDITGTNLAYAGAAQLSVMGAWYTDFDDVRVYNQALSQFDIGYLYEEQPDCSVAASIADEAFKDATVGPNPTNGTFTVLFGEEVQNGTELILNDATGRVIARQFATRSSSTFDLSEEAAGLYQIRLGPVATGKTLRLIKE